VGQANTEVDLRGLRVDEADDVLLRALDAAVLADLPYLRVIHGKGTGALRDRVRDLLAADPRVTRAASAPANQGGTGVTVAELA
jgi:DNA mismatch repair protein MutS2